VKLTDPHPWWQHLPAERRSRRQHARLVLRRLRAWLLLRRQQIGLASGFYLLLCLLPILLGRPALGLVALLPLLLVPPVGYLIYWLMWKEFHH
jgi:hypothetical protein